MARHPLTAVPATRSSLPLLQIRRRLVLGFLALAVVSVQFSTVAWIASGNDQPPTVEIPDQSAVSLAQTVVEDFLAARRSSVPAVEDVTSDFSAPNASGEPAAPLAVESLTFAGSTQSPPIGDQQNRPAVKPVLEKFHATIAGKLYAITVPMVRSGSEWLLAAAPSITPERVAANETKPGIDYEQLYPSKEALDANSLPAAYRTQIKTWADTFARAGRADPALYRLVDNESAHTYSGLGGWTLVTEPQLKSAVPVSSPHPGYVVRVGLVLRASATNGPTLSTEYDLYLRSDKSQSQPPVVAWGAVGSYWSLAPYFNADQR